MTVQSAQGHSPACSVAAEERRMVHDVDNDLKRAIDTVVENAAAECTSRGYCKAP